MKRWFWIIGFAALWLSANPVLDQTPGDFLQGSGSGKVSKISVPERLEPKARSPGAGTHLRLIDNIDAVRTQVVSDEENLPKDGDERLARLIDLTHLYFILGELGTKTDDKPERQKYYEKGRHYAELVTREHPQRVEGHYWLGLNLLGLASVQRAGLALIALPIIVKEMNVARDLDEAYDQAGPDRVLGRLYLMAPSWPISVGDPKKSLEMLRAAVKIAPKNSTNHLFLAETLLQMHQEDEAHLELKKVLSSTGHSVRAQGLEEDRQQALWLIKKYKKA